MGVSVWRLLGGTDASIPAYAAGGHYRERLAFEACVDELAGFVAAGYGAVKLKSGTEAIVAEERRIAKVCAAIGEAAENRA